jgi:hypothetical protein
VRFVLTRFDAIKQCEEEHTLDLRNPGGSEIVAGFFAGSSETFSLALFVSGKVIKLSTAGLEGFNYIVAGIAALALGTGAVTAPTIIARSGFEKFLLAALNSAPLYCEPFFGPDSNSIFINALSRYVGAPGTLLIAFVIDGVHVEAAAGDTKCDIE